MLQFVLTQWRNVRQRKLEPAEGVIVGPRTSPAVEIAAAFPDTEMGEGETKMDDNDDVMEPTQPSDTLEVSQPHSLWSEEMGDVSHVDPTAVKFHLSCLYVKMHPSRTLRPLCLKLHPRRLLMRF
jgi:hypothetical protein